MEIRINKKSFIKSELIHLVKENKLQAIIHIRNTVNISLKDAKEIVENLDINPNYYDNTTITIAEKDIEIGESINIDIKEKKKEAIINPKVKNENPFLIKNKNQPIKWFLIFILLLAIWVYYFILQ